MSSSIVKKKKLQEKICTKCFDPKYIKFNFSYIKYDRNFTDEHKAQLVKRMIVLSKETYIVVSQWPKNIGFEIEDKNKLGISLETPPAFLERFPIERFNNKYGIIRLYPNNNPVNARLIGVFVNKIFYIFYIDINGELYNH